MGRWGLQSSMKKKIQRTKSYSRFENTFYLRINDKMSQKTLVIVINLVFTTQTFILETWNWLRFNLVRIISSSKLMIQTLWSFLRSFLLKEKVFQESELEIKLIFNKVLTHHMWLYFGRFENWRWDLISVQVFLIFLYDISMLQNQNLS